IDAQKQKVLRRLTAQTLELPEGDRSLIEFSLPLDIKGTKLLTHSYKDKDDDQWLYLPSMRRVRRISSSGRSSSFMGSEFTYEDLSSQEIEKYHFNFLEIIQLDGHAIEKLEKTPKQKSGYSKMISYINPNLNSPVKVEYYDRKGDLLKVAEFQKFETFELAGKKQFR